MILPERSTAYTRPFCLEDCTDMNCFPEGVTVLKVGRSTVNVIPKARNTAVTNASAANIIFFVKFLVIYFFS